MNFFVVDILATPIKMFVLFWMNHYKNCLLNSEVNQTKSRTEKFYTITFWVEEKL